MCYLTVDGAVQAVEHMVQDAGQALVAVIPDHANVIHHQDRNGHHHRHNDEHKQEGEGKHLAAGHDREGGMHERHVREGLQQPR